MAATAFVFAPRQYTSIDGDHPRAFERSGLTALEQGSLAFQFSLRIFHFKDARGQIDAYVRAQAAVCGTATHW